MDKLCVVERGDLVFVFNFHPVNSYTDYRVGCKLPGDYKVRLREGAWRQGVGGGGKGACGKADELPGGYQVRERGRGWRQGEGMEGRGGGWRERAAGEG